MVPSLRKLSALLLLLVALLTACRAAPGAACIGTEVRWAFTREGQAPERLLLTVLDGARERLDLAIYSLTHPDIVQAVIRAKQRGVAVRLLADREQAGLGPSGPALRRLRAAGIPVRVNAHPGLMHLKVAIADGRVVAFGSFNFTTQAARENDEVLAVVESPDLARAWTAVFDHMWQDRLGFHDLE
jgi:phosphatidylserine/phosphatidylglycerophosphate/cardiolipin synthase-like enzyme